jgi:hypothetical protein
MFPFRPILAILVLVLFTAATTGMPVLVHYCGGEPTEQACPPDECCGDEATADPEEDPCCTDEVTVTAVDDDAPQLSSRPDIPPAPVADLPPVLDVSTATELRRAPVAPRSVGPAPPPDLAVLSVLRI